MSKPLRILGYGPYNHWKLHGMWELTLLQGARVRGHHVDYLMCDGLFKSCDLYWESRVGRDALACTRCQATAADLASGFQMPFRWLGRFLQPADLREAERWAASVPSDELTTASYGDWPVAEWIRSSVHSDQRAAELDLSCEQLVASFRRYLYSGLVACMGLSRALDELRPDVLLTLSGRLSSTRIAMELALRRGVRVVCHERGRQKESISLFEGCNANSRRPLVEIWERWGDVPLSRPELEEMAELLRGRERGTNHNWHPFSAPPTEDLEALRVRLGLRPGRPLWVLFTTGFHEVASLTGWTGPWERQIDWIVRTVDYARRHPEIDLVIRTHPNAVEKAASGAVYRAILEFRELCARLPENARVLGPQDEISSYSLMDACTLTLIYNSTAGIEASCKGKPVVVACGSALADLPYVHTVKERGRYEALLDALTGLPVGGSDPEIQRLAWRFAYGYFARRNIRFPLVRMPDPHTGELAYDSLDDLRPGRDAGLDRALAVLVQGEPVCPPPTPQERARDDRDERAWFGLGAGASEVRSRRDPMTPEAAWNLTS